MPIEVEQKYHITDPSAVLARVSALGAVAQPKVTQVDTYYAHPVRDFAATDEALRIRRVGECNFITYKGPKLDVTTKTRREVEVSLANGESSADGFDELLEALGFCRVTEVSKVRQIFRLQREEHSIELAIDDVKEVGSFIELEIIVAEESEIPTAQRLLATLASELQLAGVERKSYLELFLEGSEGSSE